MSDKLKAQKQILFSFLFDIAPEISDRYCKASKEERERIKEVNKQALARITGTRA